MYRPKLMGPSRLVDFDHTTVEQSVGADFNDYDADSFDVLYPRVFSATLNETDAYLEWRQGETTRDFAADMYVSFGIGMTAIQSTEEDLRQVFELSGCFMVDSADIMAFPFIAERDSAGLTVTQSSRVNDCTHWSAVPCTDTYGSAGYRCDVNQTVLVKATGNFPIVAGFAFHNMSGSIITGKWMISLSVHRYREGFPVFDPLR